MFSFIEKHEIPISVSMSQLYTNMFESWNTYLSLLDQAEQMLDEKQDEFKDMLLRDYEQFQLDVREFSQIWEEFKKRESINVNLRSTGLYKWSLSKNDFVYLSQN